MASPPIELDAGWQVMQRGINKLTMILEKKEETSFTAEEYMSQYTTIYNMCTQRAPHEYSEQLYTRYREAFVTYLQQKVLRKVSTQDTGIHLLSELSTAWENQQIMVRWLARFFNYLDRYFVGRNNLPNLNAVGLMTFRDIIFHHIHERAKDALLELITKERENEPIDRDLVKNVLRIFIEVGMANLDMYKENFEKHLLVSVHTHYKAKAAEWIHTDSCAEYLIKAEESLQKEEERADYYLHSDSKVPVIEAVQEELLTKVQMPLIEKDSGCSAMLRDNRTDDLARMFRLYHRCGGSSIEPMAKILQQHIHEEGNRLVADVSAVAIGTGEAAANRREVARKEKEFIQEILSLQDKYLRVVRECFQGHSSMHKALKDAFESFCNKSVAGTSTAELMASFCDSLLRSPEGQSEEELDSKLESVVKLLVYINDRDVFSEWHRKKLARRLLSTGTVHHLEHSFLQRLKAQCGAQFTQKMEGMCSDLQTARGTQNSFSTWKVASAPHLQIDLDVKVLTTGFWPSYAPPELTLPAQMATCVQAFQDFYDQETRHRRLNWINNLGNAIVTARFSDGAKELVLHPFQAALLMLFNDKSQISLAEIKSGLNLPEDDVVRTVASLANKNILKKVQKTGGDDNMDEGGKKKKGKKFTIDDVFAVNTGFSDRKFRLTIPMPVVEDRRKVVEEVERDRKYAIDAAIVRIMKSRRALEHSQLVVEVMQQVRRTFTADNKAIRNRLGELIDKEYIARDETNLNMYRYLA